MVCTVPTQSKCSVCVTYRTRGPGLRTRHGMSQVFVYFSRSVHRQRFAKTRLAKLSRSVSQCHRMQHEWVRGNERGCGPERGSGCGRGSARACCCGRTRGCRCRPSKTDRRTKPARCLESMSDAVIMPFLNARAFCMRHWGMGGVSV